MSILASLITILDNLILAAAQAKPIWDTSDARTNILFFPTQPLSLVQVRQGTLAARAGGLQTDSQLRPRVSAIIGSGATIGGLAELLLPVYNRGGGALLTARKLAQAIAVYNQIYLPATTMANYKVGLRIPLPIEVDQADNAWIIEPDFIQSQAAAFVSSWQVIEQRPSALELPNPAALREQSLALIQNTPTLQAKGIQLHALAMTNPFDAVFLTFEVFRQLGADAFATALVYAQSSYAMQNHQNRLLASLTAGNALLRRIMQILSAQSNLSVNDQAAVQTAIGVLKDALGLGASATLISPRELPKTASQGAPNPSKANYRIVLGRTVLAGVTAAETIQGTTFRGPALFGTLNPSSFIADNIALLNPNNEPTLAARLSIVQAIAVNEALFDGIRLRDAGILSTGFQQWSAHVNTELSMLLWRFKQLSPDEYMLYFGLHGLEVRIEQHADGQKNPTCMLQKVQLQGNNTLNSICIDLPLSPLDQRLNFFGGNRVGNDVLLTSDTALDWAARFRIAALSSLNFRCVQVLQAACRFDRLSRDVGNVTVGEIQVKLRDLVSSQYGAALLLDSHINKPGKVRQDLQNAISAVPGTSQVKLADILEVRRMKLRALEPDIIADYRDRRDTFDTTSRNKKIDKQNLSKAVDSFQSWAMGNGIPNCEQIFQ
jgi:hypothetical protein